MSAPKCFSDERGRSRVSNQVTGVGDDGGFGANSWLVEELYEQFKVNRDSVDKEWWPILEKYHSDTASAAPSPSVEAPAQPAQPDSNQSRPVQACHWTRSRGTRQCLRSDP